MSRIGKDFNKEQLKKIMKQIDEDGDGNLSLDEFVKMMQSWNTNNSDYETQLKEAFDVFDKDGDGTITAKELNTVLQGLGMPVDKGVIDLMIEDVDQDGNGEIDFAEFKKMMNEGPQ